MDPARMLTESLISGPELENDLGQTGRFLTCIEGPLVSGDLPLSLRPNWLVWPCNPRATVSLT